MGDRARWSNPATNPCLEEADAAYKCMDKNNYDRDACEQYFEAYKECKKAMNLARRQGVPFVKDSKTNTNSNPNPT